MAGHGRSETGRAAHVIATNLDDMRCTAMSGYGAHVGADVDAGKGEGMIADDAAGDPDREAARRTVVKHDSSIPRSRSAERLDRDFAATARDRLWVGDQTSWKAHVLRAPDCLRWRMTGSTWCPDPPSRTPAAGLGACARSSHRPRTAGTAEKKCLK